MLKHIHKLTQIQLCNLFGLNEIRYTKDSKKRQRFCLTALAWFLLIAVLVFYVTMLSIGLCILGLPEIILTYLYMITSIIILFFSFFKAGSTIFQMKNFDMMVSLPISQTSLVVSRFLSMYITDLLLSFLVMIPGTVIYSMHNVTTLSFYLMVFIGTLFLPMIPLTISTFLGVLFTGIGARMKHKNLATAILMILFTIIALACSIFFSSHTEIITSEMLLNLAEVLTEQIGHFYPPAIWFGIATMTHCWTSLLKLLGLSFVIFMITLSLVSHNYLKICQALHTTSAKKNYKMGQLHENSILKALCLRDIKRYFASSAYVSNTIMSYLMMLLIPFALLFTDIGTLETYLGFSGILHRAFPILLGFIAGMMPITSCSISMEGKNWWLIQTLPILPKQMVDSKLLMNLIIACPFYIGTILLSLVTLKPTGVDILWLILIPAAYILFSCVTGLSINIKFPVFSWTNETQVVKQSTATLITLLIDCLIGMPFMILIFACPFLPSTLIMGCNFVLLLALALLMYQRLIKKPILYSN